MVVDKLKGIISYFKGYRENEFTFFYEFNSKIAYEMEIEPIFCEKRIIHRKKIV